MRGDESHFLVLVEQGCGSSGGTSSTIFNLLLRISHAQYQRERYIHRKKIQQFLRLFCLLDITVCNEMKISRYFTGTERLFFRSYYKAYISRDKHP
jgi:hypothetical protein